MRLILASKSPRRHEILKEIGLDFEIYYPEVDEFSYVASNPYEFSKELAYKKARSVGPLVSNGVILGADTIVVLNGNIIGKPKDKQDAYNILTMLSDTVHEVITGIALINVETGKELVSYSSSKVYIKPLTKDDIITFTEKHLDKAGCYGIQDKDDEIATILEGSYSNVVGLDKDLFIKMLKLVMGSDLNI